MGKIIKSIFAYLLYVAFDDGFGDVLQRFLEKHFKSEKVVLVLGITTMCIAKLLACCVLVSICFGIFMLLRWLFKSIFKSNVLKVIGGVILGIEVFCGVCYVVSLVIENIKERKKDGKD